MMQGQALRCKASTTLPQRCRLAAAPRPASCRRPRQLPIVCAKDRTTGNEALDNALSVMGGMVDTAADLVPDSVPRPVAKGGVAVAGGLVAFWLLQKVVSTVLTLVLLGGAAYLYFRSSSSSDSSSSNSGGGSSSGRKDDGLDDPLADARRIMDKYK